MITKYLKDSVARIKKAFIPAHPHLTRSELVDDEIIVANSWDDVPFDVRPLVPYHSISDEVKAGKKLQKLGGAAPLTGLDSAIVGQTFLNAFAAAGAAPAAEPASAAGAAPAAEPASAAPANN